jgi:hypothetical protein
MGTRIKQYLTVIPLSEVEQANQYAKIHTANYHDLFYVQMTDNGETPTHYVSHHPFDKTEAENMKAHFTHFYDMSETTKEAVFKKLGLEQLPQDDEIH